MASPWPGTVQCLVARATGDQGLAAIRYHPLDPQGFLLAAWLVQVRKPAALLLDSRVVACEDGVH